MEEASKSDEGEVPLPKPKEISILKHNGYSIDSRMGERHSSSKDPDTIKTVSSVEIPVEQSIISNPNLNFIHGHEKLM